MGPAVKGKFSPPLPVAAPTLDICLANASAQHAPSSCALQFFEAGRYFAKNVNRLKEQLIQNLSLCYSGPQERVVGQGVDHGSTSIGFEHRREVLCPLHTQSPVPSEHQGRWEAAVFELAPATGHPPIIITPRREALRVQRKFAPSHPRHAQ